MGANVQASLASAASPSEDAIAAHKAREEAERAAAEGTEPKPRAKPGPKPGSKKTPPASTASRIVPPGQGEDAKDKAYRAQGRQIADLLIMAGQTLGGEDWKPVIQTDAKGEVLFDERGNLRAAWEDFCVEYQWEKMPAWIGVTFATASYVGPRLNAPSTVSRLDKLKAWWINRKVRKAEEAKAKAKEEKD